MQWTCHARDIKTWESSSLACQLAWFWIYPWVREKCKLLLRGLLSSWSFHLDETCHTEHMNCEAAGVNRSSGCSCFNSQCFLFSFHHVDFDEQAVPWNFVALLTPPQSRCYLKFQNCPWNGSFGSNLVLQPSISTVLICVLLSILHLEYHTFWVQDANSGFIENTPWRRLSVVILRHVHCD